MMSRKETKKSWLPGSAFDPSSIAIPRFEFQWLSGGNCCLAVRLFHAPDQGGCNPPPLELELFPPSPKII